jgi:hypothetical protein
MKNRNKKEEDKFRLKPKSKEEAKFRGTRSCSGKPRDKPKGDGSNGPQKRKKFRK